MHKPFLTYNIIKVKVESSMFILWYQTIHFFEIVPLGVSSFFQMVRKWKGVFIGMDSLLTMVTNSFENPIIQKKLDTFFIIIFLVTLWNLFPFLEISAKFIMSKVSETQVHSFHAHIDIKEVFTFLKKHIHEWKHS